MKSFLALSTFLVIVSIDITNGQDARVRFTLLTYFCRKIIKQKPLNIIVWQFKFHPYVFPNIVSEGASYIINYQYIQSKWFPLVTFFGNWHHLCDVIFVSTPHIICIIFKRTATSTPYPQFHIITCVDVRLTDETTNFWLYRFTYITANMGWCHVGSRIGSTLRGFASRHSR